MITPTTVKSSFPYRGATKSAQLNDMSNQVATDIHNISAELNRQEKDIYQNMKIVIDEMSHLNKRILGLEQELSLQKSIASKNGLRITYHQSMYDNGNLKFMSNNVALRPSVNAFYGIAHLPVNAIENKFYSTSIYNGDILTPASLDVTVNGTFVEVGKTSPTNFDEGATVDNGNPKNAFNGNNTSYWVREVKFPSNSDVTEVQCEVIATVPSQNNTQSNVLTINPYPHGNVDVLYIGLSSDTSGVFTSIPNTNAPSFSDPLNNATQKKYIFTPRDVDQVKVILRTRNFIEENGHKVFRLGLQELGLYLVDFEKSTSGLTFSEWSGQGDDENISMVHRIDAPAGTSFTAIHHFVSDPDISLEEDLNRHIIFRIYDSDPTTSSGIELWNSNQTYPQDQPDSVGGQITLGGNVTSIYVVTSMRFVETSGGANSPFNVNTSPYIYSFSMELSATQRV